jgi:hypothetical protein
MLKPVYYYVHYSQLHWDIFYEQENFYYVPVLVYLLLIKLINFSIVEEIQQVEDNAHFQLLQMFTVAPDQMFWISQNF